MEATAHGRFQRYGARKVNQVLDEIRGKAVLDAEQILPNIPRISGVMVSHVLKSAAANLASKAARQGKTLVPEKVYIKSCWATIGPLSAMKRVNPAPQGRAMTFHRKICHVTVVVSDGAKTRGAGN
jgi:large subunit ribosomal protein L22